MPDLDNDEWDQGDAWLEARTRRRVDGPASAPSEPTEQELPGSIYYVPHKEWKTPTRQPKDRPGVCVLCDVPSRWAWLSRGLDAGSPVLNDHDHLVVPSSPGNGLGKLTAFLLDEPHTIRLHRLLTYHSHPRLIGRLEDCYLSPLRQRFLDIVRANRRGHV
jgi:hypothetical protein